MQFPQKSEGPGRMDKAANQIMKATFWLGEAAERDPEVLMAYYPPEPLVVIDDSEGIDE